MAIAVIGCVCALPSIGTMCEGVMVEVSKHGPGNAKPEE